MNSKRRQREWKFRGLGKFKNRGLELESTGDHRSSQLYETHAKGFRGEGEKVETNSICFSNIEQHYYCVLETHLAIVHTFICLSYLFPNNMNAHRVPNALNTGKYISLDIKAETNTKPDQ